MENPLLKIQIQSKVLCSPKRCVCVAVAACVIGILIGLFLPNFIPELGVVLGSQVAVGNAATVLGELKVNDSASNVKGYDRTLFGYGETDDDGDGCEVRQDILKRDLDDVTFSAGSLCQVASGTLVDPYTGKTINFKRGKTTSMAVQIDHVVALSDAWKSGANKWDAAKRYRFGNDPENLLAVDGPANTDKSDASAAYWLPPNKGFDCEYVARQITVKARYSLSVTSSERDAMLEALHECPGQDIFRSASLVSSSSVCGTTNQESYSKDIFFHCGRDTE
jgi:hypothetical protein